MYKEIYTKEFLQLYLVSFVLLAYSCPDTLVRNKNELCDRVLDILEKGECLGSEQFGMIIEVSAALFV